MKQYYEKGITFYCIDIEKETEKMFKIMKEVYNNDENKFYIEKIGNSVHDFTFFVSFSASELLGNTKYNSINFNQIIINYRNEIIEKIMDNYIKNKNNEVKIGNNNITDMNTLKLINEIENLNIGDKDKKLLDFIDRMSILGISDEKINKYNEKDFINIKINENKINGNVQYEIKYILKAISYNKNIHAINDWINPSIILKSFKTKLILSYNTLNKNKKSSQYEISIFDKLLDKNKKGIIPFYINKKYYDNSSQYLKDIAYNDLICEQIADYFNIFLAEKLPYQKNYIKFKKHILYEIDFSEQNNNYINDEFYLNNRFIISEESIPFELNIKSDIDKRTLQAYSHFSYQITGGQMLITNLIYDKNSKKISDYKIYSLNENGYKNILEFFASHICDKTCKELKLVHPRKKINPIIINEKFFSYKYLTDFCLCYCCSVPIKINEFNKKLICGSCLLKENSSRLNIYCSKCNSPFSFSSYQYNCKLENYPERCPNCSNNF